MALVNALFSPQTFTRVGGNQGPGQIPLSGLEEGSNTWNREGDAWKTFHRSRGSEPVA